MKILTFSRYFPKGHPKAGEQTHFVEKIWNCFRNENWSLPDSFSKWAKNFPFKTDEYLKAIKAIPEVGCKFHTIRTGSRFKSGDMASLRVWSDKPYRSKQIEFAQVEIKRTWNITINEFWFINDRILEHDQVVELAKNDGLTYDDFIAWFACHPKKKEHRFDGQIIAWDSKIEY